MGLRAVSQGKHCDAGQVSCAVSVIAGQSALAHLYTWIVYSPRNAVRAGVCVLIVADELEILRK